MSYSITAKVWNFYKTKEFENNRQKVAERNSQKKQTKSIDYSMFVTLKQNTAEQFLLVSEVLSISWQND